MSIANQYGHITDYGFDVVPITYEAERLQFSCLMFEIDVIQIMSQFYSHTIRRHVLRIYILTLG